MKSGLCSRQMLGGGWLGRQAYGWVAVAGMLFALSAWGQSSAVQASIDNTCSTQEARFVVPPGQVARGFSFDSLRAGLSCTTRTQIYDRAWGISNQDPRSGNVYYYNHNRSGTIYSLTNNRTTPLPLDQLVLPPGAYHAHVDGGINASVTVYFRLEPAAGAAPAPAPGAFPLGWVWQFGRSDGSVIAARVKLIAGGTIQGYSHPNEHHWGLEGGKVVFYNAASQPTTRFLSGGQEGGVMVLRGAFLPNQSITHVLSEVGRDDSAGVTAGTTGAWEYIGIGDCPGNDIAGGAQGNAPDPRVCDVRHAGLAAVCWDSTTPRTMSPPGCTVKSVRAENCTGGVNPGRMYRCNSQGAGGVATPAAPVTPSAGSVGPMEADTDMMGYDIGNLDLATANPSACQAECLRTPNCRAWTYVKPDTKQGPRPRCWLKSPVPGRVRDACCVSGVVNRP